MPNTCAFGASVPQINNMQEILSITESEHGARRNNNHVSLGKYNKKRFNCFHKSIFNFIPTDHVLIDTLHLFLWISNVLTDLLI